MKNKPKIDVNWLLVNSNRDQQKDYSSTKHIATTQNAIDLKGR